MELFMRNHEVFQHQDLLNQDGRIAEPGFARTPVWRYNRENLPASHLRMKEWDYYMVMTDHFGVAFTISDLGYLRMASVSFLDFEKKTDTTKTFLGAPSMSYTMPASSDAGICEWKSRGVLLRYETAPNGKHIYCEIQHFEKNAPFRADLWFENLPEESMNIAIPWKKERHFYLNQKINCMPCSGKVIHNWHVYHFDPAKDFGVQDWGRGYWPHETHWYWGTCSSSVKGKPFGFNLGYGFGDTSAASENMVFYHGKSWKLDDVEFQIPENPMDPWTITSSDGSFEAVFTPDLDRAARISLGPVSSDQHQYFGLVNGTCVLDGRMKVKMENLRAAFEDIANRY